MCGSLQALTFQDEPVSVGCVSSALRGMRWSCHGPVWPIGQLVASRLGKLCFRRFCSLHSHHGSEGRRWCEKERQGLNFHFMKDYSGIKHIVHSSQSGAFETGSHRLSVRASVRDPLCSMRCCFQPIQSILSASCLGARLSRAFA